MDLTQKQRRTDEAGRIERLEISIHRAPIKNKLTLGRKEQMKNEENVWKYKTGQQRKEQAIMLKEKE
ncbi:hypothetical protein RUM43_003889 [Polyplax serrata]|uniref:Uncharacterized protein n=1 Tax=Polyplax serrata TaxID=468196 RepID=A0AAN8S648_POLSC